jgi:hypothetical protein
MDMGWTAVLDEVDRVRAHTDPAVQRSLDEALARRVAELRDASEQRIARRLEELDAEWDIERVLEVNAATVAGLGIVASAVTGRRRLLLLPLAVALFLLQHGIQGWCPPLAVFRRREVRTRREIDLERTALKTLRGDLSGGQRPPLQDAEALLDAAAYR